LAFDNFIKPTPTFAGAPGKSNCHGKSISALAQQYGGLNNAAAALGYPSLSALQNAIEDYCESLTLAGEGSLLRAHPTFKRKYVALVSGV
jgi:hypothetical protein